VNDNDLFSYNVDRFRIILLIDIGDDVPNLSPNLSSEDQSFKASTTPQCGTCETGCTSTRYIPYGR